MHSISVWNFAKSPNYATNVDMVYPYSEVPYIGNYKLVKIPIATDNINVPESVLIEHVDYWGEGRINTVEGTSGFPNCYNVNHQYQLVSNGTDTDRKIPNRIPVISYTDCNTSSYIHNNSVKLVTLMGAPINKSCATDIARMVHQDFGQVVVFGFKNDATDIKNLEEALAKRKLLFCHGYKVPELLKEITLFPEGNHRGYLNITDLSGELYKNVIESNYDNAVNIAKALNDSGHTVSLSDVVTKLLKEGTRNVMGFAYKLWNQVGQNMVTNYFPLSVKLILNGDYVKIMSKKNVYTLFLDTADTDLESNNKSSALGDDKDVDNLKLRWKFEPILEGNDVSFKIFNVQNEMYIKLEVVETDKKVLGSKTATGDKFQWYLDPLKVDDVLLFFIVNKEFNQGLHVAENADTSDKKRISGYNGSVHADPNNYGWYIVPW